MKETELLEARRQIAGFLKSRRKELGITQDDLAEMCGMGVATIRRFESGKFWLNSKQLVSYCYYLHCIPAIEKIPEEKDFLTALKSAFEKKVPDSN